MKRDGLLQNLLKRDRDFVLDRSEQVGEKVWLSFSRADDTFSAVFLLGGFKVISEFA